MGYPRGAHHLYGKLLPIGALRLAEFIGTMLAVQGSRSRLGEALFDEHLMLLVEAIHRHANGRVGGTT